jgi:hypothetical protein
MVLIMVMTNEYLRFFWVDCIISNLVRREWEKREIPKTEYLEMVSTRDKDKIIMVIWRAGQLCEQK